MLLGCPTCHATFRVPAGAVKEKGRTVRCAKCRHEWHAFPVDLIPEISVESALKTADEIEKKLRQEELEKQRHEVESMLAGMGMAMQDDSQTPPAAAPMEEQAEASKPSMDLSALHDFDFEAVPVQDPEDEQEEAFAVVAESKPEVAEQEEAAIHDPWAHQEEDALISHEDSDEDVVAEEEPEEEPEEAYKVSAEEMEAFSSLVSQEELDAIDSKSALEALTGEAPEAIEDLDTIAARLAEIEATAPKKNVKMKDVKQAAEVSSEPTIWLSLTLAACILLCISTAFITQQDFLRSNFAFADKLYNQIGYTSSEGLELVDLKMTKNLLADKASYDIEGAIHNTRTGYAKVPAVRIRLVDTENKTMRSWDFAQDRKMEPNEKITFSAPKLKALTGTEGTPSALLVDIGNGLEMMQRK